MLTSPVCTSTLTHRSAFTVCCCLRSHALTPLVNTLFHRTAHSTWSAVVLGSFTPPYDGKTTWTITCDIKGVSAFLYLDDHMVCQGGNDNATWGGYMPQNSVPWPGTPSTTDNKSPCVDQSCNALALIETKSMATTYHLMCPFTWPDRTVARGAVDARQQALLFVRSGAPMSHSSCWPQCATAPLFLFAACTSCCALIRLAMRAS
jgi:hypothetical protein